MLVKGFIAELMIASRPPYPQAPGSVLINVIAMYKKKYNSFDVSNIGLLS